MHIASRLSTAASGGRGRTTSELFAPDLSTTWLLETERRRLAVVVVVAVVGSLAAAALLLLLNIATGFLFYGCLALIAIAWRPRIGLYLFIGFAMILEYLTDDPLMWLGRYLYSGAGGSVVSPFELLLLFTTAACIVGRLLRGEPLRGGRLRWQMLLFLAALTYGLAYGAAGGGSTYIALWEVRFLLYIVVGYFATTNMIRTRRDVDQLMMTILIATTVYAIEGAYRKLALIDTGWLTQDLEDAWGHDSAVFLSNAILLVLATWIFRPRSWTCRLGTLVLPVLVFTLLASHRRAANVTLIVSILAFSLVFLIAHRRAFMLLSIPVLVCGAIYFPIFWNNTGVLGQPARAVRSMFSPDARDLASNYYRDVEKINVRATILAYPITGVGFGQQFLFVVPLADLSFWTFWRYEPHNNIMWIWLKVGAPGFMIFWSLMGAAIARAAYLVRTLRGDTERAFALFTIGVVISTLVFCWVDTGMTFPRFTAVLGIVLGVVAMLDQIDQQPAPAGARPSKPPSALDMSSATGLPNG